MLGPGRARYYLLFVLAFALTCKTDREGGDLTEPPPPPTTGSLTLTISGLPDGTAAAVNITGPSGFTRAITATGTIASLAPGTYTVTASDVTTAQDRYGATPASQSVTVTAGTTPAAASVTYTMTTGRLTVTVAGLPPGTNAAITVTGPGGFNRAITVTTTLTLLAPGAYTLTAAVVTSGGITWNPGPASQDATVSAGATATATVTYTQPQPGPDLLIWGGSMESPIDTMETFSDTACAVVEGLVQSGTRRLMRFGIEVRNAGTGDLVFGDPARNPLFAYAPCHDHYHFEGFALYRLVDSSGQTVGTGLKVGFCLSDYSRWDPSANPNPRYYYDECNPQGIQAGWSDIYGPFLDGQWVDITAVPAGRYTLELTVDPDNLIAETDETNNVLRVQVTISPPAPGAIPALQNGVPVGTGIPFVLPTFRAGRVRRRAWVS